MISSFSIGFNLYNYIRHHLDRDKTILELGSGEVSGLLTLDYDVYSVEHDPEYLYTYPTNYIKTPIKNGWYSLKKDMIPEYDLILIDGPPEKIGRGGILQNLDLFDLSKPVIVDDTHRRTEQQITAVISKRKGRKTATFNDQHNKKFSVIW